MNEELQRTIEFLTQGPSRLEIYALELTYFATEDREILVPHLHGVPHEGRIGSGRETIQWDEHRFFADVRQRGLGDEVAQKVRTLLEFSKGQASRIYWGTGKETGSFTFHYSKDDQWLSMFSVFSDGRLGINLGWLVEKVGVEQVERDWAQLQEIGNFDRLSVREDYRSWPSMKVNEALPADEDVEGFMDAIAEFGQRLAG